MRILVVGNGGREHAICWKLSQSKSVEKLFCAPGNAGIASVAECLGIPSGDSEQLLDFALKNSIDLTVVGPEAPLCDGIVDIFKAKNLKIFGPDEASARLEGSKSFSKDFMNKYNIPTAEARTFGDKESAVNYVKTQFKSGAKGLVVKADGLAAGKGVIVALDELEALRGVSECFDGNFGDAGKTVLIEECLFGEEASILALTDGMTIVPLASSQDHKRLLDGDNGPNTGGMGAYSPAPVVNAALQNEINEKVLNNFLRGINAEKMYYRGIIYAGIMVTDNGPKVLEFNVRFGDPETQAVLARLESDLAEIMLKTSEGKLSEAVLKWSEEPAVCVVMASGGYPGSYSKGNPISGLDKAAAAGALVFHAGTSFKDGKIVNSGGRVLGVTARGFNISDAIAKSYNAVREISWQGVIYRKDIAFKALNR